MNLAIRRFLACSLVLASGIFPVASHAVPIEAVSNLEANATQPIEISGDLSPALREALGAVLSGQYDDALTQTTKIIVDRPPAEAAAAYEIRGTAQFLKGDMEAAITALKRSIETDPKRSSAYTKLGSIDIEAGYLDDARTNLERAIAMNPKDNTAHQRLAMLLERQGDRAGAMREYTAVIAAKPPTYIGVKLDLARLYNLEKRFGDTISLLEPIVKPESTDAAAALTLSAAYIGNNDAAHAVTLLRAVRARLLKDVGLAIAVGIAERAAGQLDAALSSFQRAGELKSNWPTAYFQIGLTYLAQKKIPEAQAAFEKAQALTTAPAVMQRELSAMLQFGGNTDQVIAALRTLAGRDNARLSDFGALAMADMALGQVAPAEQAFRDGLKRFASDPLAYVRLGAVLALQRKDDDALKVLNDGIAAVPNDPRLLRDLAIMQARLKRYDDAIATAQRLVSLDHKDADRQFLLGTLYEGSGDTVHAIETYQRILATKADHVFALNNLASLLSAGSDPASAIPLARRAVDLAPQSSPVQDTLGWALLQAGQAPEAVKVLQKARDLAPADPEAWYRLAVAQKAAGDRDMARRNAQKALLLSANFKDADAARKLLTSLTQ